MIFLVLYITVEEGEVPVPMILKTIGTRTSSPHGIA